jgi:hypothetical protein
MGQPFSEDDIDAGWPVICHFMKFGETAPFTANENGAQILLWSHVMWGKGIPTATFERPGMPIE